MIFTPKDRETTPYFHLVDLVLLQGQTANKFIFNADRGRKLVIGLEERKNPLELGRRYGTIGDDE